MRSLICPISQSGVSVPVQLTGRLHDLPRRVDRHAGGFGGRLRFGARSLRRFRFGVRRRGGLLLFGVRGLGFGVRLDGFGGLVFRLDGFG